MISILAKESKKNNKYIKTLCKTIIHIIIIFFILRLKKFSCTGQKKLSDRHCKAAKAFIKSYAIKHNLTRSEEEPITPSPACSDKKKLRFFDSEMALPRYNPREAALDVQIKQYESSICNTDVLSFWRSNDMYYPTLSKLVRRLFSYQATSVSSERLFSSAGYSLWDRRSQLSSSKLNKICILQQYLQHE